MEGMYVTVEGIDGAGKTTAAKRVADGLEGGEYTVEPSDDMWLGEAVRQALRSDTSSVTDLFLFMADRAEHLERTVLPGLESGATVVSDRSADSTYAYQSQRIEGDVPAPWEWLDELYAPWNLQPDLTLYLDVSVDTALERVSSGEKYENREMLERARENYERLAGRYGNRYVRVDAEQPAEDVARDCLAIVRAAAGLNGVVDETVDAARVEERVAADGGPEASGD